MEEEEGSPTILSPAAGGKDDFLTLTSSGHFSIFCCDFALRFPDFKSQEDTLHLSQSRLSLSSFAPRARVKNET